MRLRYQKKEKNNILKGKKMSDLKTYIKNRKSDDKEFAENYDIGYQEFKIGLLLKKLRQDSGLSQDELAIKLHTKKSVISRIENHADDIRLSTLRKYAKSLGKKIKIEVI